MVKNYRRVRVDDLFRDIRIYFYDSRSTEINPMYYMDHTPVYYQQTNVLRRLDDDSAVGFFNIGFNRSTDIYYLGGHTNWWAIVEAPLVIDFSGDDDDCI